MRFLIIGASGFVGSHVLSYTKANGHEAIGTQGESNKPGLLTFNLLKNRIEESVDPAFFETNKKVFVVICAALSQIDKCLIEKKTSYEINVENTIQLINDVKKFNCVPVFLSSSCVYSGDLGYYNEESVHDPVTEYGRHKEAVEQFLLKNVPEAFILRLDKIVSDDITGKHLFSDWYQKIKENQPVICFDQLFSPTFVGDIAESIVKGCQNMLSGAYNVANPEFFTRVELAKQFAAAVGKRADIILKPHKEFDFADVRIKNSYLDSTKFRKETGMRFTSMREVFNSYFFQKTMKVPVEAIRK